jgi:inner membrane transporter RhtA
MLVSGPRPPSVAGGPLSTRRGTAVVAHAQSLIRRGRSAGSARGWLGRRLDAVPPPMFALSGMFSLQFGSAVAKDLFAEAGPVGTVCLRLVFAAVVLMVAWRPSLRIGRQAWPVVIGYGVVLAGMNLCFYEAIDRLPLGMVVTIEFLGPLTVALLGTRRWTHLVWAVLAAGGVALLTSGGGRVSWLGVGFTLCAATLWGCYIHLSAALGRRTSGGGGLAVAMSVGGLVALPFGIVSAGAALLNPVALIAGFGVALLSSVIPYSVELEALRRMPARVFGILMSLEPAVAALAGLIVLGQTLRPLQWVAIVCVVAASVGATRTAGHPTPEPEQPLDP